MSCYEWERGEFTLPTGAASKLKAHLDMHVERQAEALIKETSSAWETLKKVPVAKRENTLIFGRDHLSDSARELMRRYDPQTRKTVIRKPAAADIHKSLRERVAVWGRESEGKKLTYKLGDGATITFTGANTVVWDVPENNHAVDHAHDHPLAVAFFGYLDRHVPWTARSGGSIVGNNEYNREGQGAGDGGNFTTRRYGRDKTAFEKQMQRLVRRSAPRTRKPVAPKSKPSPTANPLSVKERFGEFRSIDGTELFKLSFDGEGNPTTIRTCTPHSGQWSPSRSVAAGTGKEKLAQVSKTPAANRKVSQSSASAYGKATGSCLMCGKALSDPSSKTRGYGPECASKLRAS